MGPKNGGLGVPLPVQHMGVRPVGSGVTQVSVALGCGLPWVRLAIRPLGLLQASQGGTLWWVPVTGGGDMTAILPESSPLWSPGWTGLPSCGPSAPTCELIWWP